MDDREYELKQLELALKDREVTAREREVAAKEKESNTSKWFNPVTIAIYVAAIGLFGNMWTTSCNNGAAARTEHQRAQSELIQSVIKTGGNELDTCGNLDFFARIGLLDDPNQSIHNACGNKGEGRVPTLPALTPSEWTGGALGGASNAIGLGLATTLYVRVYDATSQEPIANARVDLEQPPPISATGNIIGMVVTRSTVTDANGFTTLSLVSFNDRVTVSKDGYETATANATGPTISSPNPTLVIALHATPAAKKK
jgi:hypothetical protein